LRIENGDRVDFRDVDTLAQHLAIRDEGASDGDSVGVYAGPERPQHTPPVLGVVFAGDPVGGQGPGVGVRRGGAQLLQGPGQAGRVRLGLGHPVVEGEDSAEVVFPRDLEHLGL